MQRPCKQPVVAVGGTQVGPERNLFGTNTHNNCNSHCDCFYCKSEGEMGTCCSYLATVRTTTETTTAVQCRAAQQQWHCLMNKHRCHADISMVESWQLLAHIEGSQAAWHTQTSAHVSARDVPVLKQRTHHCSNRIR